MVIFDSNIFIYAGTGKLSLSKIDGVEACYASITCIETLGFHKITAVEQRKLTQILEAYTMIDLDKPIIQRAVSLRQEKNLSLGDAIIAATALEHDYELWTANVDDFVNVSGLRIYNPLR